MRLFLSFFATAFLCSAPSLHAEVPRVVTDIGPVQSLVSAVMGDLGEPDLLIEPGANEHDLQLRPSQMRALANADLLIWVGPVLTPWLERALKGAGDGPARFGLMDAPGTILRPFAGEGNAATRDPHVWLDPANARLWLGLIADELAARDPANAAVYHANAAAAEAGIAALDAQLAARLAPVKDRPIVTYHDALGYFAAHYGLNLMGSLALGDAAPPGAAHVAELAGRIQAQGAAACLFPEADHDPALVQALTKEVGAPIGPAIDLTGLRIDPGPDGYAALITALADTLLACFGA